MRELIGREINEASGVGAFLRRWHGAEPALGAAPGEPRPSPTGNINIAETEGSSPSLLLAASDARFDDFLEPAVAPLVRAAIEAGWITYTSCEGHIYRDGSADELHVGIIARNDEERAEVERAWQGAAAFWNRAHPESAVEPAIAYGTLRADGRIDVPTIDLYLCRSSSHSWETYFERRGQAADIIGTYLRGIAA
jgi:hypothetical protein